MPVAVHERFDIAAVPGLLLRAKNILNFGNSTAHWLQREDRGDNCGETKNAEPDSAHLVYGVGVGKGVGVGIAVGVGLGVGAAVGVGIGVDESPSSSVLDIDSVTVAGCDNVVAIPTDDFELVDDVEVEVVVETEVEVEVTVAVGDG